MCLASVREGPTDACNSSKAKHRRFTVATETLAAPSGRTTRLRAPKDEAVKAVRLTLERGLDLKAQRIRSAGDLEEARKLKTDWTQQTTKMLLAIYEDDDAANDFNNWCGKVLPEFADLAQFIEHFYDEMEQRLRKLHAIMKRVETEPDVVPRTVTGHAPAAPHKPQEETVMTTAEAKSTVTFNEMPTSTASVTVEVPPPPKPAASQTPQVKAAPPRPMGKPGTTALIVRARNEQVEESITSFVSKLNFDVSILFDHDGSKKNVIQKIESSPKITFAMILASADEVSAARRASEDPESQFSPRAAFEIGYCAGKLGFSRVVVLHTSPQAPFHDEYGMIYIPVDPADGWQLQLARHLKRAGVEVDMNRLC